jgi:rod shape-determining protein MreD
MNTFAFVLSLIAFLVQLRLYPHLPILPFMPFLTLLCLSLPLQRVLALSAATGFLLDLLSNDPFGVNALNYTLTVFLSYRFRSLFSSEVPLQFALFTAILSFLSTQLQLGLFFLFDRRIDFLGSWWLTQWGLLPAFDATFALIWFVGPLAMYRFLRKNWLTYWRTQS